MCGHQAMLTATGGDDFGKEVCSIDEISKYEPLREKYEQAEQRYHNFLADNIVKSPGSAILYGLQKQIQIGDCETERPSSMQGSSATGQWCAWKSCCSMSEEEAMMCYIDEVARICN